MEEAKVIPQKRPASEAPEKEQTPLKQHHYSTRSTTASHDNDKQIVPRLKPLPYTTQDLYNELKPPHKIEIINLLPLANGKVFYTTEDHPFNRRGFKYTPCRPNPYLKSLMYSTTDLPPYDVRISYFDRSQGCYMDDQMKAITTDQGWRTARTNIGLREGNYYMEFKILRANDFNENDCHVRIGIGRKEASMEAPIGFDGYGYGLRDKTGQKLHLSRPVEFMKGGFRTGDVIGMLVELPSLDIQRKICDLQIKNKIKSDPCEVTLDGNSEIEYDKDIVRDQIPIKYKSQLYFEQYEYTPTTRMQHLLNPVTVFGEKAIPDKDKFKPAILPNSKLSFYKNGEFVGTAFENLYCFLPPNSEQSQNPIISSLKGKHSKLGNDADSFPVVHDDGSLGYYPMLSCFKNGCVEINPGPNFECISDESLKQKLADNQIKSLSERYNEKVVEDIVFDIIDEIESEYLDALEA
ncbi:hypothetical protein PACTADRAFT_93 [Pachysolen tannophilus NRRL Y-2460]|uniref:B30.2/SPRY domain-containing protein n=1 Tax=Pachysolen tannophilus NRRL Y-2460 TaxID=669874 RepID=A0A1E4U0Q2_PACTA|nr:hypothetical protein PACTADRAFT_93 [Pachysolen tannophilus NRRL Y-2460]